MRQRIGGVAEPWWRPMLRCPCFWGDERDYSKLCVRWHIQKRLGRDWDAGRITGWSLRWMP